MGLSLTGRFRKSSMESDVEEDLKPGLAEWLRRERLLAYKRREESLQDSLQRHRALSGRSAAPATAGPIRTPMMREEASLLGVLPCGPKSYLSLIHI